MTRPYAPCRVTLRAETPADRALSFAAFASTRDEELGQARWSPAQQQSFLEQQFEAQRHAYRAQFPDASFDIVDADGVDVGRCYVDRDPRRICLLDIVLLRDWRGIGIGRRLLADLLAEAGVQNVPVMLHVDKHNPILNWYLRLGFTASGDSGMHWAMRREPRRQTRSVEAVA